MASHHHHHLLDLADPFFPFGPPSSSCPFLAAPAGFGFPSLGLGPLELELEPFPTLLHDLTDRVAALELAVAARHHPRPSPSRRKYTYVAEAGDRKLRWTAEEKPRGERALKWVAELKSPHPDGFDRKWKWESKSKAASSATKVKWATHLKGKGCLHPWSHAYTWEQDFGATDDDDDDERVEVDKKKKTLRAKEDRKKKKDDKVAVAKEKKCPVAVNIEEIPDDNAAGTVAIRKAFTMGNGKDKRKELSPQDAALLIQLNYRAHLAHRSQVLRCLRDLAVAKAKLKEIRSLFCNISYRRRIAHDHEELQRFSEKIIVLLLTVDALEGPDYMVRTAKKSMLEELEGMLDIVDAQPPGKQRSLSRRKFDLPQGGGISDEKTAGVNNAIRIIDERD